MAGSEYEIELFGKKLIYSEGKLRDIKLHFFMDDLYELIKMQVGQLFDNAGDLNGLLLVVENDANAAGFAEIWKSDDLDDAAYLSVSKGVGGTIINKREIVRGHSGFSGEFGHMTIDSNGKKCLCGRRGCLDVYCSTSVLSQYADDSLDKFFENKKEDKHLQEISNCWTVE